MGGCFSKKGPPKIAVSATTQLSTDKPSLNPNTQPTEEVKIKKKPEEELPREGKEVKSQEEEEKETSAKEVPVTKHRKSHDRAASNCPATGASSAVSSSSLESADPEVKTGKNVITSNINFIVNGTEPAVSAGVRTSSCTKEEVDAILIQCGRLSRSSSGKAASGSTERSRKYSGSKRSYDFDHADDADGYGGRDDDNDGAVGDQERHHRERSRQSRPSPQGRRRRTPSREREQQQQQRSNSKERNNGGGNGSRRVSRSPGRRSSNSSADTGGGGNNGSNRPGKMVSVPATVTSLVTDKSNNGSGEPAPAATSAVKRITVKRNVGEAGSRSTASPRARSPARVHHANSSNENHRARSPARGLANGANENPRAPSPARVNASGCNENQQQISLSRNSSRKAEQSPYRRNPLSELDPNSLAYPQPGKAAQTTNTINSRVQIKSKEFEADGQKPNAAQGANHKVMSVNCTAKEQQQILEEVKGQTQITRNVTVTAVPQTLTRSRSSRRSQDLDLNPETLSNPNPSYASLLLEDIQNFHQKNAPSPAPASFSLPPCVTKACSILEAVADLNGGSSSNLSCTFSEERKRLPSDQFSRTEQHNLSSATGLVGKKRAQPKDPFVESEIIVDDDLMEPSLHKYVTVRRGGREVEEEEESSGSNSFAGGVSQQQHWGASSWEPNSADSTDRWTSRTNAREDDRSPFESGREVEEARRGFSGKRRDFDHQQTGIGHGGIGANRGPQAVALAAST